MEERDPRQRGKLVEENLAGLVVGDRTKCPRPCLTQGLSSLRRQQHSRSPEAHGESHGTPYTHLGVPDGKETIGPGTGRHSALSRGTVNTEGNLRQAHFDLGLFGHVFGNTPITS